jgi:hypothetical protein
MKQTNPLLVNHLNNRISNTIDDLVHFYNIIIGLCTIHHEALETEVDTIVLDHNII